MLASPGLLWASGDNTNGLSAFCLGLDNSNHQEGVRHSFRSGASSSGSCSRYALPTYHLRLQLVRPQSLAQGTVLFLAVFCITHIFVNFPFTEFFSNDPIPVFSAKVLNMEYR